ncbi:MAG: radical SAM family heme chaperone HemW [Candidatus Gracilibacteria bacterium]|nr:radical SAM family heme chaperone HemW [Candidatus Gracilibacteria bacterium]
MQIYIHIPFCEQKCNYCRFASIGKIQDLHIAKYVSLLCEEITLSPSPSPLGERGVSIKTIYFGGGTPGVLKLEQFEKILNTIKNKYILDTNCEISLETTPDKITKENLEGWNKLGINRVSMGIQTLNNKSLKEISRGNKGDINIALENIKKYNLIENISVDFIIGLPYVKSGEILENIKTILNNFSFIKHISVYMLEDYYSPDKIIETKYDNITYPKDWDKQGIKEEEYLGEYSSIKRYLINSGFNNYEISNYGKPGFECKHNIGYWNHSEILAFGLGAYGYVNNIRYANSENFKNYYAGEKIFKNKLSEEDIFLEKVMFQLRTSGIEENIYKKLDQKKINYFIENSYLEYSFRAESFSPLLKLTDKGVLVMDYILSEIV